jgi:hypothetical protein
MAEEIHDNPDPAAIAAANRDAMYRLVTGANPGDLAEQVRILGGTRAAAQVAGVTQRTVQRWITKTGAERIQTPGAGARLVGDAAAQSRTTRAGRQQIADNRRATLMRNNGARMRGTSKSGPRTAGGTRDYVKDRRYDHAIGSDVMGKTIDAWVEHGDDAAFNTFNAEFGDEYGSHGAMFDEWVFYDMDGLNFNPDTGSE